MCKWLKVPPTSNLTRLILCPVLFFPDKVLKIAYRSTMSSERDRNLNFVQLQSIVEVDALEVADKFLRNGNRRMVQNLPPDKFFNQI